MKIQHLNKQIDVASDSCIDFYCFRPKEINGDWKCEVRELHGCPNHVANHLTIDEIFSFLSAEDFDE